MKKVSCLIAIAVAGLANLPTLASAQEIEKGATIFRQKCFACHRVGAGAKNITGPQLNGVVDRPAGSSTGFSYSSAQKAKAAEGLVWTEEALSQYLESPRKFIPGNRMGFIGMPSPDDRKAVIAYLKSFNEKGEQTAANAK